jgi:hypothetical protein
MGPPARDDGVRQTSTARTLKPKVAQGQGFLPLRYGVRAK